MAKEGCRLDYADSVIIEVLQTRKKILGKVDCQKTMYFAKRLGAIVPFNFRWNIFGPYSYSLAHSCDFLVMERLLEYTGMEYKINQNALIECTPALEPELEERIVQFFKAVEHVCAENNYDRVHFIECAASLDFIQANVSYEYRKKEKTFKLLEQLKPQKEAIFSQMREEAWCLITNEGLVR
ncbi:MAG: hypothetical protein ACQCN6_05925 [Candidatus Bathyarchaeia archaeon]|jgi:uncharacterized protein YwgA